MVDIASTPASCETHLPSPELGLLLPSGVRRRPAVLQLVAHAGGAPSPRIDQPPEGQGIRRIQQVPAREEQRATNRTVRYRPAAVVSGTLIPQNSSANRSTARQGRPAHRANPQTAKGPTQ